MNAKLPKKQNDLLDELNKVEQIEKLDTFPLRPLFNNLVMGIGIVLVSYDIIYYLFINPDGLKIGKEVQIVTELIFLLFAISALYFANHQKKAGLYLICFVALVVNVYNTYTHSFIQSSLVTLVDALTVFIFANQFFKKGFYIASVIIAFKILGTFFIYDNSTNAGFVIEPIAAVVLAICLGLIPILTKIISRSSTMAKKQQIRAEILALQNEDLIESWGDAIKKKNNPEANLDKQDEVVNDATLATPDYESPYATH